MDNIEPSILVTVPLLQQWIRCCEHLEQYATDDDTMTIDIVTERPLGVKIKIVLDKTKSGTGSA